MVDSGSRTLSFKSPVSTLLHRMEEMQKNSALQSGSTFSDGSSSPFWCSSALSETRLRSSSFSPRLIWPSSCLPLASILTLPSAWRLVVTLVRFWWFTCLNWTLIGSLGLFAAFAAWYCALAQMLNKGNSYFTLPVRHPNRVKWKPHANLHLTAHQPSKEDRLKRWTILRSSNHNKNQIDNQRVHLVYRRCWLVPPSPLPHAIVIMSGFCVSHFP